MSGGDPKNGAIRDATERFERVIDIQASTIESIDDKAARTLRFVALLLGVVFSAFSLDFVSVRRFDTAASALVIVGIAFLILSLIFSIITYLSTRLPVGMDPDVADRLIDGTVTEEEYRTRLLATYADCVESGSVVVERNSRWFRNALLALSVGLVNTMAGFAITLLRVGDWYVTIAGTALAVSIVLGLYIVREKYQVAEDESVQWHE